MYIYYVPVDIVILNSTCICIHCTLNKNKISHASYLHVLESTLHRVHESTSYMINTLN